MPQTNLIQGFSRLSSEEKRRLVENLLEEPHNAAEILRSFLHPNPAIQGLLSEFSENTISNFVLPYNVAPNFHINGRFYMVPMVTEESSVVAAAASAARFWADRGGFRAKTISTQKTGHVHFLFRDNPALLLQHQQAIEAHLRQATLSLVKNMEKRGGGIVGFEILNRTAEIDHYFQLQVKFETADAMGANFINSVLEECAKALDDYFDQIPGFAPSAYESVMAILSNHVPDCLVEVSVGCPIDDLADIAPETEASEFARRFVLALEIAGKDIYRAATHNKGIMNGVDAVVIATGNDFRAIEAGAHAYAARSGQYASLSRASVSEGIFEFTLTLPLAVGTIGGLTKSHPLAALSLELLGNPGAAELMQIAASAGLANNFSAVKSLITTGIQAGHMRMHLPNILTQLGATTEEKEKAADFFKGQIVSFQKVTEFLNSIRK